MSERAIDRITHKGLTIEIWHDPDCSSPRENDNLGTIVAWHRRYTLSDKEAPKCEPAEFDPAEYEICLPLQMFEHGDILLRAGAPFGDRWDSGQVGWIYVTAEKLQHEYSDDHTPASRLEHATKVLQSEVEEYSRYVNGECYGYIVKDRHGEQLDACWGFIGREYCEESAKEAADHEAEAITKRADALVDLQRSEN